MDSVVLLTETYQFLLLLHLITKENVIFHEITAAKLEYIRTALMI